MPELAEAFGFAAAKVVPYEADDLLATAVTQEEARGGGALVVSSDRDTYQLVSDVTATLHPRPRGELERVDRAGVRERYGIEPEQVPDLIALRGDPSDNIPGARGIGQKTAAELLRRHGDLEGVIAHAAELTPRQRLAIEGSADDLRRYLDVATMRRDVTMTIPRDAVAGCGIGSGLEQGGGHARHWPGGSPARPHLLECLGMEPDSLLVRGLVDNPSAGLSPALDRSTTFDREPGGASPYGRGHAPVAAEAEALLGALEDAEATVFASGMTAWTCICLTILGRGPVLALPTSGYYSLEGFASGILERFGVEPAPLRRPRPRGLPPGLRGRRSRDHRDPLQPAAHAHGHRAGRRGRACRRRAAVLRQHLRDAAPAAPARPGSRPRLAERDEVPGRALGRARRRRHDARPGAARAPGVDAQDDRRCARTRPRVAAAARPAHPARAPAAPGRERMRAGPAARRASRCARGALPGPPRAPRSRARPAPDARVAQAVCWPSSWPTGRVRGAARMPCGSRAARPASAASRR